METSHYLYKHYDKNNNLLYVGITKNLKIRTQTHKKLSRWSKLSVRMTSDKFTDKDSCYSAEEIAIKTEKPIFNIIFNNDYPAREIGFRRQRSIALAMLMPNTDFLYHIYALGILEYQQSKYSNYINFCFHIIDELNLNNVEYKRVIRQNLVNQRRLGERLKIKGLFDTKTTLTGELESTEPSKPQDSRLWLKLFGKRT